MNRGFLPAWRRIVRTLGRRPGLPRGLADECARLLGPGAVGVADVGARWGAERAWYNLAPFTRLVGFEADPVECARLNASRSTHEEFFPFALASHTGRGLLHVTRDPACASLYPPDAALVDRYPALSVMSPRGTRDVALTTLDEWAQGHGGIPLVFLKLDVQGAELDVLGGAGKALHGCMGLEVEVEFSPMYRGQPLFADVDAFLRQRGFTLWRLGHLVHYSERPLAGLGRRETAAYSDRQVRFPAGDGRLFWGHALYFRDYVSLGPERHSLAAALALAAYLEAAADLDGRDGALRRILAAFATELGTERGARLAGFVRATHARD